MAARTRAFHLNVGTRLDAAQRYSWIFLNCEMQQHSRNKMEDYMRDGQTMATKCPRGSTIEMMNPPSPPVARPAGAGLLHSAVASWACDLLGPRAQE